VEIKANGGAGNDAAITWKRGEWIHVAVVYKKRDASFRIYRNGEQFQKIDGYPEPVCNGGKLLWQHINMIGTHNGGVNSASTIALREFRFWRVGRRAAQIKNFMRLRADPTDPNLIAYYTFEDESGSEAVPTQFNSIAEYNGEDIDIPKARPLMILTPVATYFTGWSTGTVDFSDAAATGNYK
jgi:hypothetical protein